MRPVHLKLGRAELPTVGASAALTWPKRERSIAYAVAMLLLSGLVSESPGNTAFSAWLCAVAPKLKVSLKITGPVPLTVPPTAFDVPEMVITVPLSMSVSFCVSALSGIEMFWPGAMLVMTMSSLATGASFAPLMVNVSVVDDVAPAVSLVV